MNKYCAKLIGAGHALASKVITSEDLEKIMDFDKFGIRKGMSKLLSGVSERRFAEDNENSSDYAVRAAKMALKNSKVKPEEIDLVLFCSITSDFLEPATAMKVQAELGCINANCFDIKNACNAFLTGINVANMYIETGRAKKVLITSGEVLSRYLRMNYNSAKEVAEANATFSIGDGGGAIILESRKVKSEKDIMKIEFKTVPEYWDDGILWGGGTAYAHNPEMAYFQNETKEMMKTNFNRAMKYYADTFKKMNINISDISLFIPHQITKYFTVKTTEILGLPKEKVVDQISKLGNNGCAAIPIAISRGIETGQIQLGSNEEIVLLGFGNGISMAVISLCV